MALEQQIAATRQRASVQSRALRQLPEVALLLDVTVMISCAGLATMLRRTWTIFPSSADVSTSLTVAGPLILLTWLVGVVVVGGYSRDVFELGAEEFRRVAKGTLIAAGVVGAGCYLFKFPMSRGFFFLTFLIGIPALLLGRLVIRLFVRKARDRGALQRNVLIAGSVGSVDEVARALRREPRLGYRIIGALVPDHQVEQPETPAGIPVLGRARGATETTMASGVDVLVLATGALSSAEEMRRIVWDLETHAVQVVVAPSVSDVAVNRVQIRPIGGLPLMHIEAPRGARASKWGKRLFDVVGSAFLLVLAGPLLLVAAARIKLHDGGPVFFKQTRAGREGAEFSCLKFRTMVPNAELLLADLHQEAGFTDGMFKMQKDPRITAPGRWLRRYSIDELPQLVNVLRGDMSLIGPRPGLLSEVERYEGDTARRLRVRPGLTGLWQVSGRSDLSFDEAIRLDLYYVDNWSMFQDLWILLKTAGAVLSSKGAY